MMKHIYFGLLIGVFLIVVAANVSACMCAPPPDHTQTREEEFNEHRSKAVTVLSGRIVSEKMLIHQISRNSVRSLSTRQNIIVDRFWGAPVPNEVFYIGGMSSCDARLFPGKSYLIFIYQLAGNKIETGACSGNIELKYAAAELKLLGEGRRPSWRKSQKHKMSRRLKK